jgi:hypothetical protein
MAGNLGVGPEFAWNNRRQEMGMPKSDNSKGRDANAAQPLGERAGTASHAQTQRTGRISQEKAGPDGPDSSAAGKAFKAK